MGSIRQNLQAQPKNIKKLSKHQINQSKKKKPKSQKLVWGLPDRVCRFNPKILKKLSKYQIYQSERKFSKKKLFFVP
jgi:hypothetical protein